MRTFSPSDAAFEGFRIIRDRPSVLFAWGFVSLLLSAAVVALLAVLVGPQWSDFTEAFTALRSGQPQRAAELVQSFQGFNALAQIVTYLVGILITCGVYRAVQSPQDGGFGYLRIGMDEVRVGVLRFAYYVGAWIVGVLAVLIVFLLFVVIAAMVAAGAHDQAGVSVTPGGVGTGVFVVLPVLLCLLLAWPAVRLSLAEPITFAEKRFSFFDSWNMTRGLFWPMLGAYLLAWLLAVVVTIAAFVAVAVVGMFTLAGVWPRIMAGETDFATMAPAFVPVGIVWLLAGTVLGAVARAIMWAPGAYIYRALKGEPATAHEDGYVTSSPGMLVL